MRKAVKAYVRELERQRKKMLELGQEDPWDQFMELEEEEEE